MTLMFLFAMPWLSLLAATALPGPPTGASAVSPVSLIACERAFDADAASLGVRAAFLKWLAPTGVVFRPGPVNGLTAYADAEPTAARLTWTPEIAAISEAGDLGWTTGPWGWSPDSTRSEDVAWGQYLSVWRRQADGSYLAALDIGISQEKRTTPMAEPALLAPAPAPHTGRGPLDQRRTLWKADADFGQLAKQGGVAVAIEHFGAEGVLLLRDGMPRVSGRAAASEVIRSREGSATLMSFAQFLSESGDLGYTYGTFVAGTVEKPDSAYYVHIWHRGTTKPWELAVQLVQPVPKAR